MHLALKPDGGEVFVSNSLSNSVSEIYATTDEVGDTYMIGEDPVMGLVSRDNSLLYEANLHSPDVTVYSIDDGKRIGAVHVGDGPAAMAFSGAGTSAVCGGFAVGRRGRSAHGASRSSAVYDAAGGTEPERDCGEGVQGGVAELAALRAC